MKGVPPPSAEAARGDSTQSSPGYTPAHESIPKPTAENFFGGPEEKSGKYQVPSCCGGQGTMSPTSDRPTGYAFILATAPEHDNRRVGVVLDWQRLVLQLGGVAAIGGVVAYLRRRS